MTLSESGRLRDDDERYEVDFLRKGVSGERQGDHSSSGNHRERDGENRPVDTTGLAVGGSGKETHYKPQE